ncbi:hypothetical protein F5X96DRAFT_628091, partial [Biscogniauxia mediterranea]
MSERLLALQILTRYSWLLCLRVSPVASGPGVRPAYAMSQYLGDTGVSRNLIGSDSTVTYLLREAVLATTADIYVSD